MKSRMIVFTIALFAIMAVAVSALEVSAVWEKRYDNGGGTDRAMAVEVDGLGNVIVTGYSSGGVTLYDYATIKYYPHGDVAWTNRYNSVSNDDDLAYALAVDIYGNVFVTGESDGDYLTIKYYSNGSTAWTRSYNGPGNSSDGAYAIAVDDLGNCYVTGLSYGSGTGADYATIKYNGAGTELWVRRYNGTGSGYDRATDIQVDGAGNVYVTGYSDSPSDGYDYATIKYNSVGSVDWIDRYDGPGSDDDKANGLAVDGSGNVYVTGSSTGLINGTNYFTIKYNSTGGIVWTRTYNGTANTADVAVDIVIDDTDTLFVSGYSTGSGSSTDYVTIKYSPTGSTEWTQRYDGPYGGSDRAKAMALDPDGNVYITGYCEGSFDNYDWATLKYNRGGALIWEETYNGPGDYLDQGYDIAVDQYSNAYVTGDSYSLSTFYDYTTIRYSYLGPLIISAYSEVNLWVTDPAGEYIGKSASGTLFQTLVAADYYDGPLVSNDVIVIYFPIKGTYIINVIPEDGIPPGETYSLGVRPDDLHEVILVVKKEAPVPGDMDEYFYIINDDYHYFNGDANGDETINLLDIVYIINYLYKGGPPPYPEGSADSDCNLLVNILDVTYLIGYLYKSGSPPCYF